MFSKVISLGKYVVYKMIYGQNYIVHHMPILPYGTNIKIRHGGKVILDEHFKADKTQIEAVGGEICIGKNVYFNKGCNLVVRKKLTIGDNSIFAPGCYIYDHNHDFTYDDGVKDKEFSEAEVQIGSHCWFGTRVIVLKGTNIGDGCIIGAGTVVYGDIPAHSIVTGTRNLEITSIYAKKN